MHIERSSTLRERAERLARKSVDDHYNPYVRFDWVETLDDDQYWMPANLLSLYGTPWFDTLDERQIKALSKWESINFYSLNVHGIREVLHEAIARIHTDRFASVSDYLHHFIGEENGHMWFFASFCLRYGGKLYPNRVPHLESNLPREVADFMVFARVLVFEEIVDFFNVRIGQDTSVHPLIQDINSAHHKDESRHVAFGREIVRDLHRGMVAVHGSEGAAKADAYLKGYIGHCIDVFYQASVYRDAGLPDPFKLRNAARASPERIPYHKKMLSRTINFLEAEGILTPGGIQ